MNNEIKMGDAEKFLYGVGINDAKYQVKKEKIITNGDGVKTRKLVWICPYYKVWMNMITRAYSDSFLKTRPSYLGVTVCDEWLLFSNFKSWMEKQDWNGNQLDKDLIKHGNKIYSPSTCLFVSKEVNLFMTDRKSKRGKFLIGVNLHSSNRYQSTIRNPITKKQEHLGLFNLEILAHKAWIERKTEIAIELSKSNLVSNEKVGNALINKYKNYPTKQLLEQSK